MEMFSRLWRCYLDYGDVITIQELIMMHLVEEVQYKVVLIVSGCRHGINPESFYELG